MNTPVTAYQRHWFFRTLPYLLLLVISLGVLWRENIDGRFPWPPSTNNEPLKVLKREVGTYPGDPFKGRVALLFGMTDDSPGDWGQACEIMGEYRSELKYHLNLDAPGDNIPLLNRYAHWTSPPTLALNHLALGRPEDRIERAGRNLHEFRPKLARLLGASVIVSERPIPNEKLLYQTVLGKQNLYITSIEGANLGQYSPTELHVADSASRIFDVLQKPGFDGEKQAVVQFPIHEQLVPAQSVSVRMNKGPVLHVEAYSPGVSLLVLPFDFSHCLKFRGEGLKSVIPVNLAQTGLLVSGKVSLDMEYRYGIASGTECRKKDLVWIKMLDLENAATGRLFEDLRPKTEANHARL